MIRQPALKSDWLKCQAWVAFCIYYHEQSVALLKVEQVSYLNIIRTTFSPVLSVKLLCSLLQAFTASSILRTHIRQHSGERPFKCKHCGKAFASHAAHDSHVRRTHAKDKPYPCDVCTSTFQQATELKNHMNSHTSKIWLSLNSLLKEYDTFGLYLECKTKIQDKYRNIWLYLCVD